MYAIGPYTPTKEAHLSAKEIYISTKEVYIFVKEPYIFANALHSLKYELCLS
jgi:hypothetical protein